MEFDLFLMLFLIYVCLLINKAGCDTLGYGSPREQQRNYILGSIRNLARALVDQPENNNSSIRYLVYTPGSPKAPCFLKPNEEALKKCPVNPKIHKIFFIYGFVTNLYPGNMYEIMKDALLVNGPYNAIIVDWTQYDGPPLELAITYMIVIGGKVADLLKYLVKHAGISTDNVTIIGHSLGAHMAGVIGKNFNNLFRIVGLDPEGRYFQTPVPSRLSYYDASYIQVLHSSDLKHGSGLKEAIGHIDYYINGGERQPHCHYGNRFRTPSGVDVPINSTVMKNGCNHEILLSYYVDSINQTECKFLATQCGSYQDFKNGKCPPESSKVSDMGFYGAVIQDVPPLSKFYLRTSSKSPYCLKDGYKPE